MGEVWRAYDTNTDREVALKILGADLRDAAEFAGRFRRESANVARLNNPNIIAVHNYGEIDGKLFIDMALVEGEDLAAIIARGPLPPDRAVQIVGQVARALDFAHGRGLVHRDVKPQNVLVSDNAGDDHVHLIDFGIAHALEDTRITRSGAIIGTPAYMAPERFEGAGDHRSDIYALGCVLYEALTGRRPFPADNLLVAMNFHRNEAPPPPSAERTGLPPGLDAVTARAMAKDPRDRFPTGAEMTRAARAAVETLPVARDETTSVLPLSLSQRITERGSTGGQLRVSLRWRAAAPAAKKGMLGRLMAAAAGDPAGVALDLACLWEFTDGTRGVVQALGGIVAAPHHGTPIIRLTDGHPHGDMLVDLARAGEIRRVLFFALFHTGVPDWAASGVVVTFHPASGPAFEVRLDNAEPGAFTCAVAMLENQGDELVIRREVRFIRGGQADLDRIYGWGMAWRRLPR
jgi:uncharacterized protein involved in tellurium resistance